MVLRSALLLPSLACALALPVASPAAAATNASAPSEPWARGLVISCPR